MRCFVDRNVVMQRKTISVVQTKDFVVLWVVNLLRHYDARASPSPAAYYVSYNSGVIWDATS